MSNNQQNGEPYLTTRSVQPENQETPIHFVKKDEGRLCVSVLSTFVPILLTCVSIYSVCVSTQCKYLSNHQKNRANALFFHLFILFKKSPSKSSKLSSRTSSFSSVTSIFRFAASQSKACRSSSDCPVITVSFIELTC